MRWDGRSLRGAARAGLALIRDLVRSRLSDAAPLRPLYAVWYVTLRCNLACSFCDDGKGEKYPAVRCLELGTADAQRLLRVIRRGCGSIYFTGGEPLVRKDLPELLASARQLGFWPIFVNTNLSLPQLSHETLGTADVLIVSLGSTDEAKYDQVIGGRPGHTRRILENIKTFAESQALGGPQVVVNCVISAGRVEDARSVWELCREQRVWFSPVAENLGAHVDEQLFLDPAYGTLVDDILAARQRGEWIYGSRRGLATLLRARPFRCYPSLTPHIYPNGDLLSPCHPLRHRATNILEKGSFSAAARAAGDQTTSAPCGNRCHLPCYVTNNAWMEHPLEMLLENLRLASSNGKRFGAT